MVWVLLAPEGCGEVVKCGVVALRGCVVVCGVVRCTGVEGV